MSLEKTVEGLPLLRCWEQTVLSQNRGGTISRRHNDQERGGAQPWRVPHTGREWLGLACFGGRVNIFLWTGCGVGERQQSGTTPGVLGWATRRTGWQHCRRLEQPWAAGIDVASLLCLYLGHAVFSHFLFTWNSHSHTDPLSPLPTNSCSPYRTQLRKHFLKGACCLDNPNTSRQSRSHSHFQQVFLVEARLL